MNIQTKSMNQTAGVNVRSNGGVTPRPARTEVRFDQNYSTETYRFSRSNFARTCSPTTPEMQPVDADAEWRSIDARSAERRSVDA